YCGAKLIQSQTKSEVMPEYLIAVMMLTFIFGLIGIIFLIGMIRVVLELPVGQVLALALLPFLILVLLEGVFIRLLFRRRSSQESGKPALEKQQATNELDGASVEMLPEAKPSVTEHTTRTFEPIYTQRKPS